MQFRFPFLPAGIFLKMAHLIENCRFSFVRFQKCLENFVSCLHLLFVALGFQMVSVPCVMYKLV